MSEEPKLDILYPIDFVTVQMKCEPEEAAFLESVQFEVMPVKFVGADDD